MIFRVKLKIGYVESYFDFKDACQALEFLKRGCKHFNKELSEDREFFMSMTVIMKEGEF